MNGHDAVDIRILRHEIIVEKFRNRAADMCGTVDARNYTEIVAGGDTPVFAHDALECGRIGHVIDRLVIRAECVITLKIAHGQVMHMHVITRLDRFNGEADDLVITPHRRAFRDVMRGNLVPGRDGYRRPYFFLDDFGSGGQLNPGYDYVVGGVEADSQIGGLQHGVGLLGRRPAWTVSGRAGDSDRYFRLVCALLGAMFHRAAGPTADHWAFGAGLGILVTIAMRLFFDR